ncbi:MAG: hypothetical protein JWM49_2573 [Microbacteriaceae bacterium]|nr:hypothetical protein [Microbacteriaceae bacterium]
MPLIAAATGAAGRVGRPRPGRRIANGDRFHRNHSLYTMTKRAENFPMNSRATRPRDQILPVLPRDYEDLFAKLTGQPLAEATPGLGRLHPA